MLCRKQAIPSIDSLSWLASQPFYPKVYWKTKTETIAAVGQTPSDPNPAFRFFCWRHFSSVKSKEWEDFSEEMHWLPRFELHEKRGKMTLTEYDSGLDTLNTFVKKSYNEHLYPPPLFSFSTPIIEEINLPTRQEWILLIEKILRAIQAGLIHKLVPARRLSLRFTAKPNAFSLCEALSNHEGGITFLFSPTPRSAFVGCSPEILYQRSFQQIRCDALAGTALKQDGAKEELLRCEKRKKELGFVSEAICSDLFPLCEEKPKCSAVYISSTPTLYHLKSDIQAELKQGICDRQILNLLHPTPAVGGYPKEEALFLLSQLETFSRGLYAAPLGHYNGSTAEFAVGIRSALLVNRTAHLFAGCGIVEGSDPEQEWEEAESKLAPIRSYFQRT